MIIDVILDRHDDEEYGDTYNPHDFYMRVFQYGKIGNEITYAMDYGTEKDVKRALCNYIDEQEYNPKIKNWINARKWLTIQKIKDNYNLF